MLLKPKPITMKKLFALLAVVMLVACNSDDDNNGPKKYATAFRIGTDDTAPWIQLLYDNNNNLTSIVAEGETEYSFAYNGNELASITYGGPDEAPNYQFVYENGKLKGYTIGEDTTLNAISYNEQTKKYTVEDENIEIGLNGRDLATLGPVGGAAVIDLKYDGSRKGALYNVPTKDFFLLSLFANLYQYAGIRPLTSVTANSDAYTAENTYDSDGYITQMTLMQGGVEEYTIQYQYGE